jgi:hypothetical protein
LDARRRNSLVTAGVCRPPSSFWIVVGSVVALAVVVVGFVRVRRWL